MCIQVRAYLKESALGGAILIILCVSVSPEWLVVGKDIYLKEGNSC